MDGTSCEAVLLAEEPAPAGFTVAHPDADLALTIVGRGQLHATIPFGQLDQRGPFGDRRTGGDYQTGRASPAVLLVNGVDAIATSPALDRTGRTYVWAAPVRAGAVHPWTAEPFGAAVDAMTRDLRDADSAFSIASPLDVVALELARADAARGRLLFVGSLGVAILLAFAVFLAQVMRDDLDRELVRLAAAGARRRQRGLLLLLETVVPTLVGGVIGWIVGGLAVGALAATAGIPVGPIVGGALLAPAPLLAMTAVLAATAIATLVASLPVRSSAAVGPLDGRRGGRGGRRAGLGGAVRRPARPRRPDLGPRQPGGRAPATGRDLPARVRPRDVDAAAPALGEPAAPRAARCRSGCRSSRSPASPDARPPPSPSSPSASARSCSPWAGRRA